MCNLVGNAIKFSRPSDVIEIRVSCLPSPSDVNSEQIQINVIDQGVGINDEDRANLFQAFFKSSDKQNRALNPKSNGLGLHISKRIAQSIGGDLQLNENYRNGCCF